MRPYTIEANIPVWFSWNRQEGAQESRNQAISTSVGSSEQLHEIIATGATEVLGVCRRGERAEVKDERVSEKRLKTPRSSLGQTHSVNIPKKQQQQ